MDSEQILNTFSDTYTEARNKFYSKALSMGQMVSYEHPAKGPTNEKLYTDVLTLGCENPKKMIIVCSGTHGIEGFCGSGCQTNWLQEDGQQSLPEHYGMLFIHALNPYGFAWYRRTDEKNIDVNRNFVDHSKSYPENIDYDEIARYLVPEQWEGLMRESADQKLVDYRLKHSLLEYKMAVATGQYNHPDGLFFGGRQKSWSFNTLETIMNTLPESVEEMVFLDIHTGLGKNDIAQILNRIDQGNNKRLKKLFKERIDSKDKTIVTPEKNYRATGNISRWILSNFQNKVVTFATVEFGTIGFEIVLQTLRAEAWSHKRVLSTALRQKVTNNIKQAFYPREPEWLFSVWKEAKEVINDAIDNL